MTKKQTATAFEAHDHSRCAQSMMRAAEEICLHRGLRLTPIRTKVLEILTQSHVPLGAYEVLAQLSAQGSSPQPPVAYRALEFLVTNGLAHRIEKLNAFVACTTAHTGHSPIFMICEGCQRVAETPSLRNKSVLDRAAREMGFDIQSTVIEAQGLCAECRMEKA